MRREEEKEGKDRSNWTNGVEPFNNIKPVKSCRLNLSMFWRAIGQDGPINMSIVLGDCTRSNKDKVGEQQQCREPRNKPNKLKSI